MKRPDVLALIPARGGSKSIPGKNLRTVGGKALIVHSIEHARHAATVTRVIVTTDDERIASVARSAGAEVPFMRPRELAGDDSVDYGFVRHALEWLSAHEGYEPELVVQLRPTTPFRNVGAIDRAVEAIRNRPDADSLRAVVTASFTPFKMWRIGADGLLEPILELSAVAEPYNQPRQLLPTIYQQDGFIDIVRPSTVMEQQSITGRRILPFLIDAASVDIDYENELREADETGQVS